MSRLHIYIAVLLVVFLSVRCSYERKTWTSKAYHNLTAHYNGYYYALEEITKIEAVIEKSTTDDYNRVLRLFPTFDSTLAKGYEKEVEEAIKMASISIQRHPNSKWVDDAYILVGKARMYDLDWGNAIQTFKYVNTKSEDLNARHKAIITLIRTFTEHEEYNNAQAAIDFLQKEPLNKTNRKDYYLEKAYYHQVLEDYDNMVRSLSQAVPLLTKQDRRGRIYFILGQVYQKLGFESEAFYLYRKCLATNPEYETDFYARLYMAQVAEISKSRDVTAARKSFRRLLRDRKNKEFKDKIYYELGAFELKQKNLQQAITNFNQAIQEGTNKRVDGEAYLKLGEIYYDTLRDYEVSQAYYDSAINALPKDFENYEAIKARQQVLNEFVKNLKTIAWQDSLLRLSSLDSAALRTIVDSALTAQKKLEELKNKGKKNKRGGNRIAIETNDVNIFGTGEAGSGTGSWYFGNPSAVALGQTEFQRLWGDIPLQDNWRRSQRLTVARTDAQEADDANPASEEGQEQGVASVPLDPVDAEMGKLAKQIPYSAEQKTEALKKIEDAYFNLGDIYYFDLKEKDNALSFYNKLLDRFPESEHKPEVLYKLYLITKEFDPAKAEQYATILKRDFPYTTFARILINPDYLKESGQVVEKQKDIYKEAYDNFKNGNYITATRLTEEALALGQTLFSANLELLNVLITGKTRDLETYKSALEKFIETNPDSDLVPYAEKLLSTTIEFRKMGDRQTGTGYARNANSTHYFVIIYKKTEKIGEVASAVLESFNEQNHKNLSLTTSSLVLDETYALTMVGDLSDEKVAWQYYKSFNEKLPTFTRLLNYKFNKFVITNDNFNILYRTKGVNEYIQFFERNYRAENP